MKMTMKNIKKYITTGLFLTFIAVGAMGLTSSAEAFKGTKNVNWNQSHAQMQNMTQADRQQMNFLLIELRVRLLQILIQLNDQTESSSNNNGDYPSVSTYSVTDVEDDRAELLGSVDMNDFSNGEVFFVYGEDQGQVRDVSNDFDSYNDVDEDGDDLQKVRVDRDLDSSDSYSEVVMSLDDDTRHYYSICVEFEDEDDDDVLECGNVRVFTTDN